MNEHYYVIFEVLVFIEDSEIQRGERYVGKYFPQENEIKYFTNEGQELTFIPEIDSEIIEKF